MKTSLARKGLLLFAGVAMLGMGATVANADVTLKYINGNQGMLYREGYTSFFRICPVGVAVSRVCPTALGPYLLSNEQYLSGLQKQFGVTGTAYTGTGGLKRVQEDIGQAEKSLTDPDLSAEDRIRLQERMVQLRQFELALMRIDSVVTHMDAGSDVTYDASYNSLFDLMTTPFTEVSKPEVIKKVFLDAQHGTAIAYIGDMCWYDAAGKRRPDSMSCLSGASPIKGCALALGRHWSLPDRRTYGAVLYSLNDEWKMGPEGGKENLYVNFVDQPSYSRVQYTTPTWHTLDSEQWAYSLATVCVANVKYYDPTGDVDGDGIPNGVDQCNAQSDDLLAEVAQSGPRIGCSAKQITDDGVGPDQPPPPAGGVLEKDVTARLLLSPDGQWSFDVQSTKVISAVAILGSNGAFQMTQATSSSGAVSEFYANATSGWQSVAKIPLRVTYSDGRVVEGSVPLIKTTY